MFARNRAKRAIAALGFGLAALATSVGCTTTQPDAEKTFLPEEYTKDAEVGTYGVIEEDHANYEWTGRRYEDGRFSDELDNSPLNGEEYKPITADASEYTSSTRENTTKRSLTKASKSSGKPKAKAKGGKKKRK